MSLVVPFTIRVLDEATNRAGAVVDKVVAAISDKLYGATFARGKPSALNPPNVSPKDIQDPEHKGKEHASLFARGMRAAGGLFAGVWQFLLSPSDSILTSALGKLKGFVFGAVDKGSSIKDRSKVTGLSYEQTQTYDYAGRLAGLDAPMLASGFGKLNLAMADFRMRKGKLFDQLNRVGAKGLMTELRNAKNTGDAFRAIIGAAAKMGNPEASAKLLSLALGKGSGPQYQKLFSDIEKLPGETAKQFAERRRGATLAALDELIDKKKQIGILSDAEVEQADSTGDALDTLKERYETLTLKIGAKLMPALEAGISWLDKFIAAHSTEIIDRFTKAYEWLSDKVTGFVKWAIAQDWQGMYDEGAKAFAWLAKLKGSDVAVYALGAAFAVALGPIGVVAATVAAIVLNIEKIKKIGGNWFEALRDSGPSSIFYGDRNGTQIVYDDGKPRDLSQVLLDEQKHRFTTLAGLMQEAKSKVTVVFRNAPDNVDIEPTDNVDVKHLGPTMVDE